ncbi:hypothetical protein PIB30_038345 [Stylosanthes scabra]|uniref:Bifunctional inhibitor/plant lipid transfer protein/seed storage helical domain-containing protein n=1 Tax=Stylosanthes scabra TaxID=79078 RepID=A0ABU6YEN8_9FABA|nr:hypothetical protein [Stylosanthes scabra]
MDSKKWVPVMVAVMVMVMAYEFRGSNGFTMCNMKEEGLTACYPSVRTTNPVNPTSDCCNSVQTADLVCLCSYKNSIQLPLLGINPLLAVTLPYRCNLRIPVGWNGC